MTPVHAILVLIIRLWAASILIPSILTLPYYLPFHKSVADNASTQFVTYGFANSTVFLVVGILAWILAPKIAKFSYGNKDGDDVSKNVDAELLVTIGSFLIGLYYLAHYLPQLVVQMVILFVEMAKQDPAEMTGLGKFTAHRIGIENLVSNLLVVAVASWMAFRPAHIAHMFSKLRRAGLAKVEEKQTEQ